MVSQSRAKDSFLSYSFGETDIPPSRLAGFHLIVALYSRGDPVNKQRASLADSQSNLEHYCDPTSGTITPDFTFTVLEYPLSGARTKQGICNAIALIQRTPIMEITKL